MVLATTRFTASSTAGDIMAGVELTGRRAVVTGGASGIGAVTSAALARAGAAVTVAVRNVAQGEALRARLAEEPDTRPVEVRALDLDDLGTIRRFAAEWQGPLDILVNNAGVMHPGGLVTTAHGVEAHFATNHLGHFLLTGLLHESLAAADAARVVVVSSSSHLRSRVDFDDLHFARRAHDPWVAYGQSKTANALFAVAAARRWADDGIIVNALNPGIINTSILQRMGPDALDDIAAKWGGSIPWKSVEQGAATSLVVAASPEAGGVSGRYFEDCNEAGAHVEGTRTGIADYARDPELAERLWDVSDKLVAGRRAS